MNWDLEEEIRITTWWKLDEVRRFLQHDGTVPDEPSDVELWEMGGTA